MNNKNGGDTTYVSEANFESEFDTFAETFFTNYPSGQIEILYIPSSLEYALTTEETASVDSTSGDLIICRGTDLGTVENCRNLHMNYAIGFDGCAYYITYRAFRDGSGRSWHEANVYC